MPLYNVAFDPGRTQVTVSVARVYIEKGGDVVLRDGAKHGLSNNLKWLEPPTDPAAEEE